MVDSDILKMFPEAKTIIYNLKVIRDYGIEDNATCKLPVYELKSLLKFIHTINFEYIRLQADNKNKENKIKTLEETLKNGKTDS